MHPDKPTEASEPESFLLQQRQARRLAVWILAIGLILSAVVFVKTSPGDNDPDPYELDQTNSKKYEDSLERIGGKSAVLGVEMEDWFTALWHGRELAYTLAAISVSGALVCFVFSNLTLHPPSDPPKR